MVLLFLPPVCKSGPVFKNMQCTSRDPEVDLFEKSRFVALPSRPATKFIKKTSCCPRFVYIEHIPRRVKQMFMFHDFKIYTDLEQND